MQKKIIYIFLLMNSLIVSLYSSSQQNTISKGSCSKRNSTPYPQNNSLPSSTIAHLKIASQQLSLPEAKGTVKEISSGLVIREQRTSSVISRPSTRGGGAALAKRPSSIVEGSRSLVSSSSSNASESSLSTLIPTIVTTNREQVINQYAAAGYKQLGTSLQSIKQPVKVTDFASVLNNNDNSEDSDLIPIIRTNKNIVRTQSVSKAQVGAMQNEQKTEVAKLVSTTESQSRPVSVEEKSNLDSIVNNIWANYRDVYDRLEALKKSYQSKELHLIPSDLNKYKKGATMYNFIWQCLFLDGRKVDY